MALKPPVDSAARYRHSPIACNFRNSSQCPSRVLMKFNLSPPLVRLNYLPARLSYSSLFSSREGRVPKRETPCLLTRDRQAPKAENVGQEKKRWRFTSDTSVASSGPEREQPTFWTPGTCSRGHRQRTPWKSDQTLMASPRALPNPTRIRRLQDRPSPSETWIGENNETHTRGTL